MIVGPTGALQVLLTVGALLVRGRPAAWRRVVRDPPGRGAASQRARSMASPLGPSPRSLRGHPSPHVDERAGLRVSMRPARGRLSRLREWIVSYSDGRVRHIMFHFPPSPVIGAVTLLSAGTGQRQCGQVVCRTSPHAPGPRPLAGLPGGPRPRAAPRGAVRPRRGRVRRGLTAVTDSSRPAPCPPARARTP